jgi:F0F1-type ATP synthase membrane subunit b/b'
MLRIAFLALALLLSVSPAVVLAQQPAEHAPAAGDHGTAAAGDAAHAEGEVHAETIWGPISRAFNSAVLFGVLYYFLRKPIGAYLSSRDREIRTDLVTAEEMKKTATAQLAALEQKMAALPGELAALKTRGQQEIAAEEARIEQAAAADRERLLEQTRREIDVQLRIAQRELVEHASNLAVGLATERIRTQITPDDQARLVDRYLQQVKR